MKYKTTIQDAIVKVSKASGSPYIDIQCMVKVHIPFSLVIPLSPWLKTPSEALERATGAPITTIPIPTRGEPEPHVEDLIGREILIEPAVEDLKDLDLGNGIKARLLPKETEEV